MGWRGRGWSGLMEEGEGQKEGEGFHTHKYTLHVNKADEIKNKKSYLHLPKKLLIFIVSSEEPPYACFS